MGAGQRPARSRGRSRLRQLLDSDAANLRAYIRLTNQFAALEWEAGESARHPAEGQPGAEDQSLDDAPAARRVGQPAARMVEGSGADVAFPPFTACPLPPGPSGLDSYRLDSFGGVLLTYVILAVALGIGVAAAWVWTSAAVRSPATVAQHDRQQDTAFKNTAEPRVVTPAGGRPATAATGAAARANGVETAAVGREPRAPAMMFISDAAGREAVVPVPTAAEAKRGPGGPSPMPAGLPEPGGEWNLRIGQLTDSGSQVLRGKIKFWPENAGDPKPVSADNIGPEPVLDVIKSHFCAEVRDVMRRNDRLTRRDMPQAERDRRLAEMYRFAAAAGDADHFQLPEFVATSLATICQAKSAVLAEGGPNARGPASRDDGVRSTSRVAFQVAQPLPAGAELWCCLYTPHCLSAVRLNGKTLPRPKPVDGEDRRFNEFRVTAGLAVADNTLEIDVDDLEPVGDPKERSAAVSAGAGRVLGGCCVRAAGGDRAASRRNYQRRRGRRQVRSPGFSRKCGKNAA